MKTDNMNFKCLIEEINRYLLPTGPLVSLFLLGSHVDNTNNIDSDLDFLLVIDRPDNDSLIEMGYSLRKGLSECFPGNKIFIFDSPSLDRPDIVPLGSIRIHLLVHRYDWVRQSIKVKNWVFVSWSRKNKLILGEPILPGSIVPELNSSIIDPFDGLPAIARRIEYAILSLDPLENGQYLNKLSDCALSQCYDILDTFPELQKSIELVNMKSIGTPQEINNLISTYKFILNLESAIKEVIG